MSYEPQYHCNVSTVPCTSRAVSKESVLFGVVYLREDEEGFGVVYDLMSVSFMLTCTVPQGYQLTLTLPSGQRPQLLFVVLKPLLQNIARELRASRPEDGKIWEYPILVVPFQRQRHAM
jgi:hypothetical protein